MMQSFSNKSNGDKNETLSIAEYLDVKMKSDTCKIKLVIAINFMTSKNNNDECVMHSNSDNIEMINDKEDEVIEELFQRFFFPDIKLGWKH